MENAIGCIVGNAYTSMLSSTGRHLSSAIWGKVSCFVAGAVAGAGVTYCVIKGKEIREKLLTLMVVDPKISKTFILDNLSHKSWKHAGNIYKINNCTTVHIRLSVPEDNGRFSKVTILSRCISLRQSRPLVLLIYLPEKCLKSMTCFLAPSILKQCLPFLKKMRLMDSEPVKLLFLILSFLIPLLPSSEQ